MTVLVVGANGATGRWLVEELLHCGENVRAVVRSPEKISSNIRNHTKLTIIHASILDLSDAEMAEHARGCDAVASCLGHNLTFKGIFGPPRRLCNAIRTNKPRTPIKFVLMNTVGNRNRDLNEKISLGQKIVILLLRLLVPPQPDNEKAADYLRVKVGQSDSLIEWAAVRPDSLINEEKVSEYELYASPIRTIFNPAKTSRINVAHFMAELI